MVAEEHKPEEMGCRIPSGVEHPCRVLPGRGAGLLTVTGQHQQLLPQRVLGDIVTVLTAGTAKGREHQVSLVWHSVCVEVAAVTDTSNTTVGTVLPAPPASHGGNQPLPGALV